MSDRFEPDPELVVELNKLTPTLDDFVLYCPDCRWIGGTNSAHVNPSHCPDCRLATRIWRNAVVVPAPPMPPEVLAEVRSFVPRATNGVCRFTHSRSLHAAQGSTSAASASSPANPGRSRR